MARVRAPERQSPARLLRATSGSTARDRCSVTKGAFSGSSLDRPLTCGLNEEEPRLGTRLIQCPIARATVAICGDRVRRAGCLNRALPLALSVRIRRLLILHTREIGLRCRHTLRSRALRVNGRGNLQDWSAPHRVSRLQPLIYVCTLWRPLSVEIVFKSGCHVERRVWEAVVPPRRRAGREDGGVGLAVSNRPGPSASVGCKRHDARRRGHRGDRGPRGREAAPRQPTDSSGYGMSRVLSG